MVRGRVASAFVALCLSLSLLAVDASAARPRVEVDEDFTPLQKAVKEAYKENARGKKDKMPGGERKDKCADAIERDNVNQIAAQCDDVGTAALTKLGSQELKHPDNKPAGKRVVTKTVIEYRNPKAKGGPDENAPAKWAGGKLKALAHTKNYLPGPAEPASASGKQPRSYGSGFLPESSDNDDHDCVDMLTGEHFNTDGCAAVDGTLIQTLTLSEGGCTHRNGSAFLGDATDGVEDDCFDASNALKTTLSPLIDEDGPEELDNDGDGQVNEDAADGINNDNDCLRGDGVVVPCGQPGKWGETPTPLIDEDGPDIVDNDGDGAFNEDGPPVRTETDCARLYKKIGLTPKPEDVDSTGDCDMGRALVKFVNDESVRRGGKKLFKAKDDGTYDPDAVDGVEPGTESRKMKLTESFGVKCKRGMTFVDGVCVPDTEITAAGGVATVKMRLLGVGRQAVSAHDAADPNISRVAMMGFTFAPPVIEWGYRIEEEVCVFGICVEIFYARIGYEFDVALGLRLPVEIEVLDQPESILAGTEATIHTAVEPLDFTTSQYEDFCEQHNLDDSWFIGGGGGMTACRRFGFTNFLDEMVPVISADKKDGDEFVARYSIFAGIVVRVFYVPIINWAIDSSLDLPAACTMMRILEILKNPGDIDAQQIASFVAAMMGFGDGLEAGAIELINFIKEEAGACGTFETPFGLDDDGAIRGWPFSGSYDIRADCAEAFVRGEVITIKGQPRPICTNMILGVSGASLGVGLGIEARAGSNLIESDFATSEDATRSGGVAWTKSSNEANSSVGTTIRADNYDPTPHRDTARLSFDDFIYYLNLIEIALKANLQFGGILSPIPDIGSFTIYRFQLSTGSFGIPIPQHNGTEAIALEIPVENYGLSVDAKPVSNDAAVRVDNDTLLVRPGEFGVYQVQVNNRGSRTGAFDNFRIALSNRPDQTPPYQFGIDRNTDQDCVAAGSLCTAGSLHYRGTRWDGAADECYTSTGTVRADRVECVDEDPVSTVEGLSREQRDDDGDGTPDEDPVEQWASTPDDFGARTVSGVAAYTTSPATALTVSVSPFRHPLTRTGTYPIEITGDSYEARTKGMASPDPSGISRFNAKDVSFVRVASFFEPQIVVLPNSEGGKPGQSDEYAVEGTNGGNSDDSMTVTPAFLDFNLAGCTLTTLGRLTGGSGGCRYRAVPTAINPAWTTVGSLLSRLPETGQLEPLGSSSDSFAVSVPRDWAGMDDTTYSFRVTSASVAEPGTQRSFVARHTVTATKESMTRYIGLEIESLIQRLTEAEAAGVKLGGLKPIAVHPIRQTNNSALEAVLAGDFTRASNNHSRNINLVSAFVHALDGGGKGLPADLFADLHARAAAMLADLAAAQASTVTSAP